MASFALPSNYHEILKAFIVNVLENKPIDLVSHAAKYFKECKDAGDRNRRKTAEEKLAAYGVHLRSRVSHDIVDDEALWIEISKERRKAIAALAVHPTSSSEKLTYVEKSPEQMQLLKTACEEVSFLQRCTEEQKSMLVNAMFERNVSKGEKIVTQGEEGDNFYLIGKGDFVFHIEFGNCCIQKRMSGKGSFGELALLYDCPRTATVQATSDGVLWCLHQEQFKSIMVNESAAKQNKFEKVLKHSKSLLMLTYDERMKLVDALKEQKYEDGTYIIQEYEKEDRMFFLTEGHVKITCECSENEITLQVGDCFGEWAMGTTDGQRKSAVAVGHVTCASLKIDEFERLLGPYKELIKRNYEQCHN